MAVVGGGILSPVLGYLAKQTGSYAHAYTVPMAAYFVIASYGFWRSRRSLQETNA